STSRSSSPRGRPWRPGAGVAPPAVRGPRAPERTRPARAATPPTPAARRRGPRSPPGRCGPGRPRAGPGPGRGPGRRAGGRAAARGRLGRAGSAPFYPGDVAAAGLEWLGGRGAMLPRAARAAYRVVDRDPVRVAYRGRDVLTNPPPSAGGTLIAYALAMLERMTDPPTPSRLVEVMAATQAERTPEFLEGLYDEGFLHRFLASRLGSTTHVSVVDA